MSITYDCSDFLQFQDQLKKLRDLDDKLIYALNTSLPTESFKAGVKPESNCKELHEQLKKGYEYRQAALKGCILVYADKVNKLSEGRDNANTADGYNFQINKEFKAEQRKLRLLQSELNVEDILKQRSAKLFNEKCRQYFKIDTL